MNCANHPDIEKVAFCRTCGKPLCANCTRAVHGVIYCESCLAARLEGVQPNVAAPAAGFVAASPGVTPVQVSSGPNPGLAGILGAIPFGVGAVYCGQYIKGLVHLGIFVLLLIAVSSDVPWYLHLTFSLAIAFFIVYQIVDAVRTARAIQAGQPAPDPFGLTEAFSGGQKIDASKVPTGAIILIGLGILFLLHTLDIWDFSAHRIWPLVLIAIGGWLLARRLGLIGEVPPGFDRVSSAKRGLMGPAILLTLGFQFLLDSMGVIRFGRTLPLLLVVIGLVKIFQSTGPGPIEGPATLYPAGTPPSGFVPGEVPPPSYPQNQPEVKPEVKNG
jgi:Domain of unknown function (DUF5668)/B-box zinc finger